MQGEEGEEDAACPGHIHGTHGIRDTEPRETFPHIVTPHMRW